MRENKKLSDMELMEMPLVKSDTSLYDALNLFKTGRSMYRTSREQRVKWQILIALLLAGHMAIITSLDGTENIGIITLEDIFEELIQVSQKLNFSIKVYHF